MAPPQRAVPHRLTMLGAILGLAACAGPIGLPGAPTPAAKVSSPSSLPSANASPVSAAEPGRPYEGVAVLEAMRSSRRPGGVPDALQTRPIAMAVADALWTWDGHPWQTLVIGGACGPSSCSLEVAGSPDGTGTDLYTFQIDPMDGTVTEVASDLHGYPAALDAELQAVAEAKAATMVAGLAFASASWLPPPDIGRYWVAYRSGGEEGSPGVDLLVDLAGGTVLKHRRR
jgi:hypothetical protein